MERTQEMNFPSEDFEYIPKSRLKAEEIASEKFFGKQLLSPEFVEKTREPIRKTLTEFGAHALTGASGLVNMVSGLFGAPESFRKYIPTPESFKKQLESWTGESLEPKNIWEEYAQDIAARAGTIAGLGGARSLTAGIGVPIAGSTVKQVLKKGGANEQTQAAATMLTDMFLGTRGLANPRDTARIFHREAEQLIPPGQLVNARTLETEMRDIVTRLSRGGHNPETAPVIAKANEIIQRIQQGNGRIDPRDLYAFRTSVNAIRGDPTTLEGGRRWLDSLNRHLNTELTAYGTSQNPQFLHALREGDEILQGLSNSRRAVSLFRAKAPTDLRNPVTWIAFGLSPKTWATGAGLTKSLEMFHRVLTSPALRRYYTNAVRYALGGDGKAAVHEMKAFDKKANQEFPDLEEGEFEFLPR